MSVNTLSDVNEAAADPSGALEWKRSWGRSLSPTRVGDRFVIAAGGTGGHVLPGLRVGEELRRRGFDCEFVGTERGLEARLVPDAGFHLHTLRVGALNRVSAARKLSTAIQLPAAVARAFGILRERRTGAVLSLGGYASGPIVAASLLLRIPLIVMEPNAIPGLANRLAARFVRRAFLGFSEARRYFPKGRAEVVGVPIREEFYALPRKRHLGAATILVTGGSQGSRTLNRAAVAAAREWVREGFPGGLRLIHQTGEPEYNEVRAEYEELSRESEIALEALAFIDDMPAAFAEADLIVCRAGASALAELSAAGKASILVPFPFAADDHQRRNAEAMAQSGAARVVLDEEWTGERMVREVGQILGAPGRLEKMEDAARGLARPGAAERIADEMVDWARRR